MHCCAVKTYILDCCAVNTDCCAVQTCILDCCTVQTCILDCCAVQTCILDCCAVQSNRLLCHATYMYRKIALLYCSVHGFNAMRAACMVVVLRYLQMIFSCLTVPNYNFLQQQSNQSLLFAVN